MLTLGEGGRAAKMKVTGLQNMSKLFAISKLGKAQGYLCHGQYRKSGSGDRYMTLPVHKERDLQE